MAPGRETSNSETSRPHPAITKRDRWSGWGARFLTYFTPPTILADRPASIPELATYAHEGGWTRQQHGLLRASGIWWWRLVGLPKTVISRYREWIWQRPGRVIPVLLLIKLLALTGPGMWVVDHLFLPAARAAVWLLL